MRIVHTKWDAKRYTIYDDKGYYLGCILARKVRVREDTVFFSNMLGVEFASLRGELEEEE